MLKDLLRSIVRSKPARPAMPIAREPMRVEDYEHLRPSFQCEYFGEKMSFQVPNSATLWRASTLLTKEPDTIDWLNRIEGGAVLFDVGANVGMYSIFAAKVRRARVIAFEPESQNYALLNENINSNGLSERVIGYCIALSDRSGLDQLFLSEFALGSSCHSLGEEVGFDLKPRPSPFVQGTSACTIDDAVSSGSVPVPDYIKIDVDGFEHRVLHGAARTLADPRVKSLIVELNPRIPEHRDAVEFLSSLGFTHDKDQVRRAARREGAFEGVGEWIFERGRSHTGNSLHDAAVHIFVPPVARDEPRTTRRITEHILGRLRGQPVQTDPFPHAVVDGVFPEDYYAEIARRFPADGQMRTLDETGRATGYPERLVTLLDEDGLSRLQPEQRRFWEMLAGWLHSPHFINAVLAHFRPHVLDRIENARAQRGRANAWMDALVVSDKARYRIAPHTDIRQRLITFLFYLPEDDRYRDLGTLIYRPKDPGLRSGGGTSYDFELFSVAKQVDFVPNRLLVFTRTDQSYHGVPVIEQPDPERRLLIGNIRLLDE